MKNTIDEFHKIYYGDKSKEEKKFWSKKLKIDEPVWSRTFWMGTQILKCPLDLWIYQEIIFSIKPDIIIECGTWNGGSALYLASICDIIKKGKILSIDIIKKQFPKHERIQYIMGSSIDEETINSVKSQIKSLQDVVLVILDSDHRKYHVINEMEIYGKLVSKGSYMIVEDSNINGHPAYPDFGEGPYEAIAEFLKTSDEFIIDKEKEKFFITFNPNGYLKKIK